MPPTSPPIFPYFFLSPKYFALPTIISYFSILIPPTFSSYFSPPIFSYFFLSPLLFPPKSSYYLSYFSILPPPLLLRSYFLLIFPKCPTFPHLFPLSYFSLLYPPLPYFSFPTFLSQRYHPLLFFPRKPEARKKKKHLNSTHEIASLSLFKKSKRCFLKVDFQQRVIVKKKKILCWFGRKKKKHVL